MRKRLALFLLTFVIVFTGCGSGRGSERRLKVVASTALIGVAVKAVGGEKVALTTITPAEMCPGHFDIQPAAVVAAQDADLLLNHGWEGWWKKLLAGTGSQSVRAITLQTRGNWMVPDVHNQAVEEITRILIELAPGDSGVFRRNSQKYQREIDSIASAVRGLFKNRGLPKVICAEPQRDFLVWLGFPVVAVYGRAEEWSAQELTRLAQVIIDSTVGLIVDNLQSGADAGKPLAEAGKIKQVTLSGFPLNEDYPRILLDNCQALIRAME